MRLDDLHLWFLGNPAEPRYVGALQLVAAGKGVSLHYTADWLANGFALSEDLPLVDTEFLPQGRLGADKLPAQACRPAAPFARCPATERGGGQD
jgi:serine/threonine-protein kinase HipA